MAALLVVLAFAGCIGGDELVESDLGLGGEGGNGQDGEHAAELPEGALREAVDPWGEEETERVLFEGIVEVGQCYDGATAFELAFGMYVMGGCAWFDMEDGILIPEGSRAVHVEADATQALHSGEYFAYMYSAVRNHHTLANGEQSSDPVHTWTFPLDRAEWDHPEAPRAGVGLGFWTGWEPPAAPPLFDGPVQVRVVAEKDPGFEALPVFDPWLDWVEEDGPEPGVITLLDETHRWETWYSADMQRKVPENASMVAVGVSWDEVENCQPGYDCWLFFGLYSRGHWAPMLWLDEDRFIEGEDWYIMLFEVLEEAWPDSHYVQDSYNQVHGWIIACPELSGAFCASPQPEPLTIDVRYLVEAWQGEVDVDAFKGRLGVS